MGSDDFDGFAKSIFNERIWTPALSRLKFTRSGQIDQSLRRLLQHHEVIRLEDPDRVFAEGEAQEAVLAAKKEGKVRFIGFTEEPAVVGRAG